MKSCFVVIQTDSSFCKHGCETPLRLLTPKVSRGPAFYICTECHAVFEVGVGEVEYRNPDAMCEHPDEQQEKRVIPKTDSGVERKS